jgi:hypothetical protein
MAALCLCYVSAAYEPISYVGLMLLFSRLAPKLECNFPKYSVQGVMVASWP